MQGFVTDYTEDFEGITVNGIEFFVGLVVPGEHLELHEDGSFAYYAGNKIKEFVIGMDTACVGLGINNVADEILAARDEWQPGCCLNTLTDGQFGNVFEGSFDNEVKFIVLSGFLDEDTGYSKEDILNYLVSGLNIELVRNLGIDEVLSNAKDKSDNIKGLNGRVKDDIHIE